MSIFLNKVVSATTPAGVFEEHYTFLMDWALRFTHDNRAAAEDLVQQTFVKFVTSPPLASDLVTSAKPLLYTYLKNVHGAEIRKVQRHPMQSMTTIEFDSLQMSLRGGAGGDPIELQDELRNIVSYLCWRKESLKPASILLLRFFYSYAPDEIGRICLMSRQSIDHGISTAREEVREHISSKGKLSIVRAGGPPATTSKHIALRVDHFMEELESIVAGSKRTFCLPKDRLLAFYSAVPRKALTAEQLSHVVSCKACLQRIHEVYEFPDHSDKGSKATLQMPKRSAGRGKKKVDGVEAVDVSHLLELANVRSRETHLHRPKTLTLIVNGEPIASQDVSSSTNAQRVEWKAERFIEFIEVESEQGVCLLAMPVNTLPPHSAPEISREVELSDGRNIAATLTFGEPAHVIEVTYIDPLYFSAATSEARRICEEELFEGMCGAEGTLFASAEPSFDPAPKKTLLERWKEALRRIRMPDFNPSVATAIVLALASIACLVIWTKSKPLPVSANDLLVQAETWDPSPHSNHDPGVFRQEVAISTPSGSLRRVLYRDAHGMRKPRVMEESGRAAEIRSKLRSAGVNWTDPLSASTYQDWHDHQHIRHDRIVRTGSKLLVLTTTTPDGPVSQETITVREADFHPVMRTVEFRGSETIEIAELNFEVVPWSKADSSWFEPVVPNVAMPRGEGHRSVLPSIMPALDSRTLDLAELETRVVLSRLNADETERLELARASSGIQVKGIVATSERKHELERALHLIPHVMTAVYTFDEMQQLASPQQQITHIATANVAETASPLQLYLEPKGWKQDDIGDLSQSLFDRSATIDRESTTLLELQNRFGAMDHSPERERAALSELVEHHRAQLNKALSEEQALLVRTGIQPPQPPTHNSGSDATESTGDAAKRNRSLCNELLSGAPTSSRPADVIVSEILAAMFEVKETFAQVDLHNQSQATPAMPLRSTTGKP